MNFDFYVSQFRMAGKNMKSIHKVELKEHKSELKQAYPEPVIQ